MSYPQIRIHARGAWLTFSHVSGADTPAAYPWLAEIGTLRSIARASHMDGIGTNESPNVRVLIDNRNNQAWRLLGLPLRCRALIEQDGQTLFEGIISRAIFGPVMSLEIEA